MTTNIVIIDQSYIFTPKELDYVDFENLYSQLKIILGAAEIITEFKCQSN